MIVVTSGCQSASIAAALGGMLPYVDVLAAVPAPDDPVPFRDVLATTRIWITSLDLDDASAHILASGTTARVLRIPNLYFNGFHPDIVHVTAPDGTPLGSAAGEYASAILVYGWKLGLDHEQIRAFFSADAYERLGYTSVWDRAVEYTRARFDASDVDFAGWYLPLVRRGTFMLTDNHPAIVALVQLARQLGALLGRRAGVDRLPMGAGDPRRTPRHVDGVAGVSGTGVSSRRRRRLPVARRRGRSASIWTGSSVARSPATATPIRTRFATGGSTARCSPTYWHARCSLRGHDDGSPPV